MLGRNASIVPRAGANGHGYMTEPPSRQVERGEVPSGGVEHEKGIISYLQGKVGGIMFWAVQQLSAEINTFCGSFFE